MYVKILILKNIFSCTVVLLFNLYFTTFGIIWKFLTKRETTNTDLSNRSSGNETNYLDILKIFPGDSETHLIQESLSHIAKTPKHEVYRLLEGQRCEMSWSHTHLWQLRTGGIA